MLGRTHLPAICYLWERAPEEMESFARDFLFAGLPHLEIFLYYASGSSLGDAAFLIHWNGGLHKHIRNYGKEYSAQNAVALSTGSQVFGCFSAAGSALGEGGLLSSFCWKGRGRSGGILSPADPPSLVSEGENEEGSKVVLLRTKDRRRKCEGGHEPELENAAV